MNAATLMPLLVPCKHRRQQQHGIMHATAPEPALRSFLTPQVLAPGLAVVSKSSNMQEGTVGRLLKRHPNTLRTRLLDLLATSTPAKASNPVKESTDVSIDFLALAKSRPCILAEPVVVL